MSLLAFLALFEYHICYGSTVFINILLSQCRDRLKTSEYNVYNRRQILTSEVGPRDERVKIR